MEKTNKGKAKVVSENKQCSECLSIMNKLTCDGCGKKLGKKIICGYVAGGNDDQAGHFCSTNCMISELLCYFDAEIQDEEED
jgi:hypothetical protein